MVSVSCVPISIISNQKRYKEVNLTCLFIFKCTIVFHPLGVGNIFKFLLHCLAVKVALHCLPMA